VDLVGGSGSGNGTPCGRAGGQLERITEGDQDRRPVRPEDRPPFRASVPWQATGTTGAPDRTAR
jgi:hypothetical protein